MFYIPKNGHGLPHNPFNAVVTPRPIAWVSTRDTNNHANLAPYSFFNAVAYDPPQIMFASTSSKPDRDGTKDTVSVIRETGVFCINIVAYDMREKMNLTSGAYPKDVDEFALADVQKAECVEINVPRVEGAPASLECKMSQIVKLPGEANHTVFGEVVGIHLRDDCLKDGIFDVTTFSPLARLGYKDYSRVENTFSLKRPESAE